MCYSILLFSLNLELQYNPLNNVRQLPLTRVGVVVIGPIHAYAGNVPANSVTWMMLGDKVRGCRGQNWRRGVSGGGEEEQYIPLIRHMLLD